MVRTASRGQILFFASMQALIVTDINFTYSTACQSRFRRGIVRSIEALSGQRKLRRIYQDYIAKDGGKDFFDTAIEQLKFNILFDQIKLDSIPKNGPVLFIANHPFGVADGIIFTWLARQVRPDVKVMANHVLCQAPEASKHLLPVNFDGTRAAAAQNVQTRKQALASLQQGGAIGVFPGGGVAASETPLRGPAVDPQWHGFVAKLVQKSGATVVPLHFAGQNSRLFQIASHTSYTLRLALFFRETHRLIGRDIPVAIGKPIGPAELMGFKQKTDLLNFLRAQTYALAPAAPRASWNVENLWEKEFTYPAHLKM